MPAPKTEIDYAARAVVCAASWASRLSRWGENDLMTRYREWAQRPLRVGDLVYETTAIINAERSGLWSEHVGFYEGTETESFPGDPSEGVEPFTREFHLLRTFQGRVVRWSNCHFARVPGNVWGDTPDPEPDQARDYRAWLDSLDQAAAERDPRKPDPSTMPGPGRD